MGKGLLLLVTATLIGGTIAWNQLNRTNIETTARQSERQEEILAREIARSGLNMTVARMRQDERLYPDSTTSMQARVDRVNGNDGVVKFLDFLSSEAGQKNFVAFGFAPAKK